MDQTHLGQFSWEPPIADVMPAVSELWLEDNANFGVAIDGDVNTWPGHFGDAVLPVFDSFQLRRSYLDVFAMGKRPINFAIASEQPWIVLTKESSSRLDQRYWVDVDWTKAPEGTTVGEIEIKGDHDAVRVKVPVTRATAEQRRAAQGRFASLTGPLAFAATAATARTAVNGVRWEEIPDYGRGDAALGVYPVTAASILPPAAAPQLDYPVYLPRSGSYEVTLVLGPTMDFVPERGMRIAVSFDDETPQVLDLFANRETESFLGRNWTSQVARDNVRTLRSSHRVESAGAHTLKVAMVDPGIVVQKIIIHDRRLPESYFGPPECSPVN